MTKAKRERYVAGIENEPGFEDITKPNEIKRTSVDLPVALWQKAKVTAIEGNVDLRQLVIAALEQYLTEKPKKGGKR